MTRALGPALLLLCGGCSTHLILHPDPAPETVVSDPIAAPLVIELVEMRKDDLAGGIDASLVNRVAMDFRQAGAFAHVIEPVDAHRAPRDAVRAVIALDTGEDPHTVANGIRGVLTWLSLFLLTPVLRYDFDAEMHAEAVLRTCDGWSKRFTSRADGSLRSALFAADERSQFALRAGVLERALVPLVAGIGGDAELRARAGAACNGSATR